MNVKIVLAADRYYLAQVAVTIQSVIKYSSLENGYHFYIMTSDIDADHQQKLKKLETSNCKIDCLDISAYIDDIKNMKCRYLTKETLYRLFIPEIFPNDDRILYIDSDMVIHDDLAKLYEIDVTGYILAACMDVPSNTSINHYNEFMVSKPSENFCAAVILINTKEFIKNNVKEKCIELLVNDAKGEYQKMIYMDQDALNVVCHGKVRFIDMSWNFQTWIFDNKRVDTIRDDSYRNMYISAMNHRKVTHFNGPRKPWFYPKVNFADEFWEIEKTLDFHEELNATIDRYWENIGKRYPYCNIERNSKLVIYGAGNNGRFLYSQLNETEYAEVVMIIDKNAYDADEKVFQVEKIQEVEYDIVIVTIENEEFAVQAYEKLVSLGVEPDKIKWLFERRRPW